MAGLGYIVLTALICEFLSLVSGTVRQGRATLQQPLSHRVFGDYLLFESPARSEMDCNALCAKDQGCTTFTFVQSTLTCRVHWSVLMSSGPSNVSQGAKTWIYDPNRIWTVLQRRRDGSVDFYRPWADYVSGFGDYPDGEFWIGLDTIYNLTSEGIWQLRFDFQDWEGNTAYATYNGFRITSSTDYYRLGFDAGSYRGTAGDSLTIVRNMQFTTKDADHDQRANNNCANVFPGAWWALSCYPGHPNGIYSHNSSIDFAQGIFWREWKGYYYSLKFTEMRIRRLD